MIGARYRSARRGLLCGLSLLALGAIGGGAHAADAIDCAKADLSVTISDVKHNRDGSRSTVTAYFNVTCKGTAVTAGYQARTKITSFTDEKSQNVTPDGTGKATVRRAEQADPGGESITVTVKGSDGDVTSDSKEIPKA